MLFSIIIPIFNSEKYLDRTLNSIVIQGFHDYQVLMINDGSTDKSEIICKKYVQKYSSFRYIYKTNSGVSETRNLGIDLAKGDYVLFVDSDDILSENSLEILAKKIRDMNYPELLIGNHKTRRKDSIQLGHALIERNEEHNDRTIENNAINYNFLSMSEYGCLRTVWAKAFSRKLIKDNKIKFQKDLRIGEDMVFLLECIINCKNYSIVNEYLYEYCINNESVMQSMKWSGFENNLLYLEAVEKLTKRYGIQCDLSPIWFEISERDWILLVRSNEKFRIKYLELKKIIYNRYYIEYSKKIHNARRFGVLFELYSFSIRNRLMLLLIMLVYIKSWKLRIGVK